MEKSHVHVGRTRRSEGRLADACQRRVTPRTPEKRYEMIDPCDVWDVIERLDEGGWDESPQQICSRWHDGAG